MISVLKRKIRQALSPAQSLFAKRLFVGSVRSVVRAVASACRLAERLRERAIIQGLDWHRAWDLKAKPSPTSLPPFGVRDLLFLKGQFDEDAGGTISDNPQIKTSIVIPVLDNAEFTFQCLRSLLREVDFSTTEIIVVNDASTDETGELLSVFGNYVRVVNNEENIGFGESCNRGAALANGRYLVFLNNDTWVLRGWLSELEQTIEGNESVGAVGSMFLNPDGRVQEAGAIIWRSGDAAHYGWCKSPDDRRLNFAREVDYCSAASLLVRKESFDLLGGFDPRYSPAYYEDADLCMGVRKLGQRVIYQPASRLIHYQGVSAGTDVNVGLKQFQVTNRTKFQEKWRGVLETDHLPEEPSNAAKAADRRRISVLVIDDRIPTPDRDAGSSRMTFILRSLAAWCSPVFVSVSKRMGSAYEQKLWAIGVETMSAVEYPRATKEKDFAAAIVSRPDVAKAVIADLRRRGLKIIFDLVDVSFVRLEREYKLNGDPQTAKEAARAKRIEMRMAGLADLIWCASADDQRIMSELVPETPSVVIPTIHPIRHHDKPFDEREGLLFVGNMRHRPNSDAVQFLIEEIMPLVWLTLPGIKLYIVGSDMTPDVEAYSSENVRVLGYVPDIEPLFKNCRLMVAPLRFGAGINGKVGESLANGLPVVTTSLGARNFGIRHEEDAMIADTPHDLAAAVVRLYRDPNLWQHLADNGQQLIEAKFSPDAVEGIINGSIRDLIARPEHRG